MDGNGNMNLRNWGFLEPPTTTLKSHLGLQLMSSMAEKPLFGGGGGGVRDHQHTHPSSVMASTNGGPFHHHRVGGISEAHFPMDYWMNQNRDKDNGGGGGGSGGTVAKKRGGGKVPKSPPKEKKPRTRTPRVQRDESAPSVHRARTPKKRAEIVINGVSMDISEIPIPVCSCTGTPQQCYRWGSGGWQSACCTTGLSMYPLPMSTKRRGARIAGRKMSIGAFKKVLEKLASEGYNSLTQLI
ncbi:UNVERIFIED_CONTAM: protein BASIC PENTACYSTEINE3 [Sesamum radiatum]|uniref:GAGA-binding transcriptional activator n=1 Tax=Sesamum radiatum TaxID=300843 RepID=A0AAW2VJY7_SESRA